MTILEHVKILFSNLRTFIKDDFCDAHTSVNTIKIVNSSLGFTAVDHTSYSSYTTILNKKLTHLGLHIEISDEKLTNQAIALQILVSLIGVNTHSIITIPLHKNFHDYISSIERNSDKVFGRLVYSLEHVNGISSKRAFLSEFLQEQDKWPPLFYQSFKKHIIEFKKLAWIEPLAISQFDIEFFHLIDNALHLEFLQYVHDSFLNGELFQLTESYKSTLERTTLKDTFASQASTITKHIAL